MYILFLIGHLGVFMIKQYGIRQYEKGRIKGIMGVREKERQNE